MVTTHGLREYYLMNDIPEFNISYDFDETNFPTTPSFNNNLQIH